MENFLKYGKINFSLQFEQFCEGASQGMSLPNMMSTGPAVPGRKIFKETFQKNMKKIHRN